MEIVEKTRNHKLISIGLSTRAALSIINAAKTSAFIAGRDYVIPDDIVDYYEYTMVHRIMFKDRLTTDDKKLLIKEIIKDTRLPYD